MILLFKSYLFLILLYRWLDLQEKHAKRDNPEETCQKETKKEVENHVERDEAPDLGRI